MPEESKKNPQESKEPFVPKEDRPEVKITMDTPLSELRVRDLSHPSSEARLQRPLLRSAKLL